MKDEELRDIQALALLSSERLAKELAKARSTIEALQGEVQRLTEQLAIQTKAAEIGAKNLVFAADEVQRYRTALEDIETYPPFEETNNGDRFYEQMRSAARKALNPDTASASG